MTENNRGHIAPASILVLGVGNILFGDEGVGVRVIEAMKETDLPENVELVDGGTASLDIQEFLRDRERVIIVDAVLGGGGTPGTVYRFLPDEVSVARTISGSLHDIGLMEMLSNLAYTGDSLPDIIVFGIEIAEPEWSLDLSPDIAAVIPAVIARIHKEIKKEE